MKTRPEYRTRRVPQTLDGKTHLVDETYTVNVPVPPRDWDRTVLSGVTTVAAVLLAACVVWSTANVGALLTRVAVPPAAYAAACAFDAAWIVFMAVEWLARYDPARAAAPRRAGHAALLVAMAAVGAHGWLSGQAAVGVISAVVSGIVKTVWTVVLRFHAKPLDSRTQQWVDAERAEVGGQLALVAIRRELTRHRAAVAAEEAALRTNPDADPDESGQSADDPEPEPEPSGVPPMTKADAVRTAVSSGITDPDAILRYVQTRSDANASAETIARYIRAVRKGA